VGSSLIGQLRILLGLETAQFETGSRKVKKELSSMRTSAELLTGALKKIGVALTIGALVETTRRALEYAASLGETAQQLGVTTAALQEYRYIGTQVGISQEQMDKSLAKLSVTMGKARDGSKQQVGTFKELSGVLGRDILKSANDAGQAIPLIGEALSKIEDPTRRSRLELELFGKTGQVLDTMLAGGEESINNLRNAAHDLGIVLSDDQIQNADKTADKLAELKMVLEARIAGAVADNAAAIDSLVSSLVTLVVWAGKATLAWRDFMLAGKMKHAQAYADAAQTPQERMRGLQMVSDIADERYRLSLAAEGKTMPGTIQKPKIVGTTGGAGAGKVSGGGRHSRGTDHTEQLAKEAERTKYELDRQEIEGKRDLVSAQRDLTIDTEDRFTLGLQLLQIEHDQRAAEIEHNLKMVELDKTISAQKKAEAAAGAKKQLAVNDQLLDLRQQGAWLQAALAREQDFNLTEAAAFAARRDRLQSEEQLATTTAERRRIELQLLDLAYQEKKEALERVINGKSMGQYTHTADERTRAELELGALGGRYNLDRANVLHSTAGPLEQLRASIPDTAAKMNEALETVAAQGLQNLNDGLAQASASWIKMGGVGGDVLRQLYTSLMKLVFSKGLSALIGALGRVAGRIGGETPPPMANTPGMATGGSMIIGGMAGIDQNMLSMNGAPLARVSQGERLTVSPSNDRGGRGGNTYVLQGNLLTPEFWSQIQAMDDSAAARGADGGLALSKRAFGRSTRRRIR
jgi:hypothetical protein